MPAAPPKSDRRLCLRDLICAWAAVALVQIPLPALAASPFDWLTAPAAQPARADDLAAAAAAARALAPSPPVLAARASPEGHWQFVNRSGETFTAGTPAEMKRAAAVLLPDSPDGFATARLVLSRDSLFAGREALSAMPLVRALDVIAGGETYPLQRAGASPFMVAVRPHVSLLAEDAAQFDEALAQLRHPLDPRRTRVLSLATGAADTLPPTPKFDAQDGAAAIDEVAPAALAEALSAIPRQIAILTARIDGTGLTFAPNGGPDVTLQRARLTTAASAADLDLVILQADPPRQPGGRNWLWQRIGISGLDHAKKRETFADFLETLATGQGTFLVAVAADGERRVSLTARPLALPLTSAEGITDWFRQAAGALSGHVTGQVAPAAIEASLVSQTRRRELAARLIPGLPSAAQAVYVALALAGLLALPVTRRWWRKLWPREARADYPTARGYVLARAVRACAFVALFVPLAAGPALLATLGSGIARLVTGKRRPAPTA